MEATALLAEALRDRYPLERELGAGGMATVYLGIEAAPDGRCCCTTTSPQARRWRKLVGATGKAVIVTGRVSCAARP